MRGWREAAVMQAYRGIAFWPAAWVGDIQYGGWMPPDLVVLSQMVEVVLMRRGFMIPHLVAEVIIRRSGFIWCNLLFRLHVTCVIVLLLNPLYRNRHV